MSDKSIAFDTGFLDKPLLHHHDQSAEHEAPEQVVQTSAQFFQKPIVLGSVVAVLGVFAFGLFHVMGLEPTNEPLVVTDATILPDSVEVTVAEALPAVSLEKPDESAVTPVATAAVKPEVKETKQAPKTWIFPEHPKPEPAKTLASYQQATPASQRTGQQVVYYRPVVYNYPQPMPQQPFYRAPIRQPKQP